MNAPQAKAEPVIGGYHAMARFVHKASFVALAKGGRPILFNTCAEAEIAALRAVLAHMVTTIHSSGERVTQARKSAEAVFRKGRMIPIERRPRHG